MTGSDSETCQDIVKEANIQSDKVGSDFYKENHMGLIFGEGLSFSGFERNKLFIGDGRGGFSDLSDVSGADSEMDCRAACRSDFDNDGDVDLFVNSIQRQTHLLYRNNLAQKKHDVVKIRLRATNSHPDAIGATIKLLGKNIQTHVVSCGSGFESQHSLEAIFGVKSESARTVEVSWPRGKKERFRVLPQSRNSENLSCVVLEEGKGKALLVGGNTFVLGGKSQSAEGLFVGKKIPPIAFLNDAGTLVDFKSISKQPTLINFWSTTCVPCLKELPEIAKLAQSGRYRVQLLNMDVPGNDERVGKMLDKLAPKVANGRATSETIKRLFPSENIPLPTTLVLDEQGLIKRIIRGVISPGDL